MTAPKRGGKPQKYVITPEVEAWLRGRYNTAVRGRVAELAQELGWPAWAVKKAARKLGLTRPWPADRRAWTANEEATLRGLIGQRSIKWIAKRLGRGETSVILKAKRLGLKRRVRAGYSATDLSQVIGCDVKTVTRWIEAGLLSARRFGSRRANDTYVIQPVAIYRFLREHRWQYRLDQVDQDWFLDFVFAPCAPVGDADRQTELVEDELAAARREEPEVYLPTPERIAEETARIRAKHGQHNGLARWQNRAVRSVQRATATEGGT